jgi:hypothetical protein
MGEIMNNTAMNTGTENFQSNTETGNWGNSEAQMHTEGKVARTIEQQTAKLPSDLFLWAAVGSIGVSLVLELMGKTEKRNFVGQWVAPFLLLGVYNKLVKVAGSDRLH